MRIESVKGAVLPQFFPSHWVGEYAIVYSPFPSQVRIGYVLRGEGSYSYILDDDFATLGVSLPELHSFALDNLRELPSGRITLAKPPGGNEAFITAEDDNFAAVRILLPEVLESLADDLGDEFLVTIPHRDWCFCWSLAQTPERQTKHAAEALEDFLKDDYRLTPDILKATRGGCNLYKVQELPEP